MRYFDARCMGSRSRNYEWVCAPEAAFEDDADLAFAICPTPERRADRYAKVLWGIVSCRQLSVAQRQFGGGKC
jgi:hypothetical protein